MKYPIELNGWYLHDYDSMQYHRETPEGHEFIDMTWLDTASGDPEYGTDRCYAVCTNVEETDNFEQAEFDFQDLHHTDNYCISGVVTKAEAEEIILSYIKTH